MPMVQCEGWWEQDHLGRQPMNQLRLRFDEHRIIGDGTDIVGRFTLEGLLKNDSVSLVKHYVNAHIVNYVGTFDGEGTLQGVWNIHGFGGRWLIKVVSVEAPTQDIQDL